MEKQQPVENKMGVEPIRSLVLKMSFPMMVSMLMQAMYNIVDSIFVSRISENALTAVSLVFPYQMLIVAVAVGTGVGVNSLVARRLGEKRQEDANRAAAHGEFLSLLSGAAFGLLFALFTPQLIAVFNPDAEIYDYACTYLYYVGVPCIFLIFQCMFEKVLQATGDTFHAMLSQLTGAIFNIVFDPILIFGLLGFPKLGVAGAAIATVLGQLLGMLVGMYYLHKDNGLIQVKLRGFRPQRQFISEIYRVGLPSIVMQAIGSVTNFGMNKILIAFTPTAVSVLGVYFKLQSFVFMPVFGLNSGTMPIMSYNYGARNRKRVEEALRCGCLYAVAIMSVGTVLFQIFAEQFLLLFDASAFMLEIGVPAGGGEHHVLHPVPGHRQRQAEFVRIRLPAAGGDPTGGLFPLPGLWPQGHLVGLSHCGSHLHGGMRHFFGSHPPHPDRNLGCCHIRQLSQSERDRLAVQKDRPRRPLFGKNTPCLL